MQLPRIGDLNLTFPSDLLKQTDCKTKPVAECFPKRKKKKNREFYSRLREFQHISMAEAKQTKFCGPAWWCGTSTINRKFLILSGMMSDCLYKWVIESLTNLFKSVCSFSTEMCSLNNTFKMQHNFNLLFIELLLCNLSHLWPDPAKVKIEILILMERGHCKLSNDTLVKVIPWMVVKMYTFEFWLSALFFQLKTWENRF